MEPAAAAPLPESVAVTITRRAKIGSEKELEDWINGVIGEAATFPGHQGAQVIRPVKPSRDYVLQFRFACQADLDRWDASEARAEWARRAELVTEGIAERQVYTGLEYWFSLPEAPHAMPPARYKMAIVTWLAITPLVYLAGLYVAPRLSMLHPLLRTPVITALMITVMTYGMMPLMTRLFARWLFKHR